MNELKELEEWLVTAIKDNDALYEYAVNVDDKTASSCVCRGLAYERVLHKIHAIQRAQERNEKIMAQQFQNGGRHDGSVTISIRSTRRYAVVNDPGKGKHYHKPRKHHIPNKSKTRELANRFNDSLFYLIAVKAFNYHRAQ